MDRAVRLQAFRAAREKGSVFTISLAAFFEARAVPLRLLSQANKREQGEESKLCKKRASAKAKAEAKFDRKTKKKIRKRTVQSISDRTRGLRLGLQSLLLASCC